MQFLSSAMGKLSTAVDKMQNAAADRIPPMLQPSVHTIIDGFVDKFRDNTLQQVPQSCEDSLRSKADNSNMAWLLHKVLGDHTDVLVSKLVEMLRPGINSSTDSLSSSATDMVLQQLAAMLKDEEEATAAAGGAGEAPVTTEAGEAGGEVATRSLAPEGGEEGGSSFGSKMMSFATASFKVDGRMTAFEGLAREQAHPLFTSLKESVWALVPSTVKEVVSGLINDQPEDVQREAPADGDGEEAESSGGITGWLRANADKAASGCLDVALGQLEVKVKGLIDQLVDDLETSSMDAALAHVREKLAGWGLVSSAAA